MMIAMQIILMSLQLLPAQEELIFIVKIFLQ